MHINIITLVLAGVLGLVFLWFTIKSTETWLIVAILAHLILFLRKHMTNEVSVYQAVAYSVIFFPGLIWWFAKRLTETKKIIEHWTEFALIAFIGFAFLSIGWASLYDFSMVKGAREFALFIPYLMYFPIRDYVAENDEKYIVIALLFVAMTVAIFDVVQYRLTMVTAHYFWQVMGARENVGEELMVSAIIIMFGFIATKRFNFYLIAPLIAISTMGLVLTFSRGYWGTGAFGLLLLVIILKGPPRRRIIKFGMLSAVAVFLVAAFVFPKLLLDLVKGLGTRIGQLRGQDLSLQSRLAESSAALEHFLVSPVIGYGMGAEFSFFNPIGRVTSTSWYIHNGYLFMLYKFGLVGTILYFLFYLRMLVLTAREARAAIEEKTKILLFSFFCIMASMLLVSFTSPQFYDRVAILILTIFWGISSGISKRKNSNVLSGEI
jgi:O-antigen ligase